MRAGLFLVLGLSLIIFSGCEYSSRIEYGTSFRVGCTDTTESSEACSPIVKREAERNRISYEIRAEAERLDSLLRVADDMGLMIRFDSRASKYGGHWFDEFHVTSIEAQEDY